MINFKPSNSHCYLANQIEITIDPIFLKFSHLFEKHIAVTGYKDKITGEGNSGVKT